MHLRDHAERDHVEPARAHRGHALDLAGIDRLDGLAEQLAEHAARVDAEREHAGEGPEPDRRDEHEREDELVDRAQHVHEPRARREVDDGMRARLRAPSRPSGTAIAIASSVPHSAMHTVTTHCQAYSPTCAKDGLR